MAGAIVRKDQPGVVARVLGRIFAPVLRSYYEAASYGRNARGWKRSNASAERVTKASAKPIREVARHAVRNNPWAKRAIQVLGNNAIGWGITPRGLTPDVSAAWSAWAGSTMCDLHGRKTFPAIQRVVFDAVATDGECFVVRRYAQGSGNPLRLHVLEADFLDTDKDSLGYGGPRTSQGIEFDELGRRVAYWLFREHPGNDSGSRESVRVPAEDVLHIFREDRPGQIRGVSWLSAGIARMNTFDEYENALLTRQKVAACFSVFVRDVDGTGSPFGDTDEEDRVEQLEPGMISYLAPGQDVSFAAPPAIPDNDTFTQTTLRGIAAAFGVTYEDLTGDYSQVNFSSSRLARLSHWGSVRDWQYHMMIPLLCEPVFKWFSDAGMMSGTVPRAESPLWTPPPMPLTDPEKEAKAYRTMIRTGAMTHDEMVAEMGEDPEDHWKRYAEGLRRLDALGIILDSDARTTSSTGQIQPEVVQDGSEDANN